MGDFLIYGESGSRYNSYLEITYDSPSAPSTEKSNIPQPFADVVTKAALSPQLCEDPECSETLNFFSLIRRLCKSCSL